jgi:GT2 family glycosyltransferase
MDYHRISLISPYAQCGALNYDLEARAKSFTAKNIDKLWRDYDFCAAVMPRATVEKVGLFDENFLVGGYEDTDYAYRMRKLGLKYGVTGASFIHHFGSQTLGEFKRRGDKHAAHNRDYFISKWKIDPSHHVGTLPHKLKRSWRKLKLRWDLM